MELAELKDDSEVLKKQLVSLGKDNEDLKETQKKLTAERDVERIQKEQQIKEKQEVCSPVSVELKKNSRQNQTKIRLDTLQLCVQP